MRGAPIRQTAESWMIDSKILSSQLGRGCQYHKVDRQPMTMANTYTEES